MSSVSAGVWYWSALQAFLKTHPLKFKCLTAIPAAEHRFLGANCKRLVRGRRIVGRNLFIRGFIYRELERDTVRKDSQRAVFFRVVGEIGTLSDLFFPDLITFAKTGNAPELIVGRKEFV